jgi:hypothetical protein
VVSGAGDSPFGGLRIPDFIVQGPVIIIIIIIIIVVVIVSLAVIYEIFRHGFRFYTILGGCFLRFPAIFGAHFLLGSRIQFYKARK